MPRWAPKRQRKKRVGVCPICGRTGLHIWRCIGCSFAICQVCMQENLWGLTCNNVTWECPDCGRSNSY